MVRLVSRNADSCVFPNRTCRPIKVLFLFRLMVKTKESPFCPVHTFDGQNDRSTHTYMSCIYYNTYITYVDGIHIIPFLFYPSCTLYTYETFCIYIIYIKHFFRSRYVCTALVCEAHSHAESPIHRFCYLFYYFSLIHFKWWS